MFLGKTATVTFTIILVVSSVSCFAQNSSVFDDTLELKEIIVTDSKTPANTSQHRFERLENYAGKRLPDLLNEISSIYLKNYGNGQLTTVAVRGTTTSQTEVLWNGIKINSPMLGQSDFALLNVGFHNSIGIQFNQLNTAIGSNILLN
ncbi:MAG TPA: TonB-dependent receptor plug domain-containing protein, partial [Chitinophagales bacterium]|nr:TonB-dependent receptor plug domain-containing protein [Chitinophagales bacterium]